MKVWEKREMQQWSRGWTQLLEVISGEGKRNEPCLVMIWELVAESKEEFSE